MVNKKLKVLLTAFNHLDVGGIQKMIMILVKELYGIVDFDIIVFSSKVGYYESEFEKYGRIFRCPHYEGNSIIRRKVDYYIRYNRIRKYVENIIRENGAYDVLHTNAFFESAPCLEAAYRMGVPVRIAHSHNTGVQDTRSFLIRKINQVYKKVYRERINRFATDCVGCSDAAREYLFGKNSGYVIYNCIEDDKFAVCTERPWKNLRLLNVGNFVDQKNQVFLIEIFKEIIHLIPDCHLTLIGRITPYFDQVKAKIVQWNLQDSVSILPYDTDIATAMKQSDYFLLPSKFEGLPLVLLEAQKSGMHCFASTSVTEESNCGLVTYIALGNAKEWADTISKFYIESGPQKHPVEMKRFARTTYVHDFLEVYRRARQ